MQLAEREGEDGEARYLVKWAGFEADPAADSWLEEGALADVSEGWRCAFAGAGVVLSLVLRLLYK